MKDRRQATYCKTRGFSQAWLRWKSNKASQSPHQVPGQILDPVKWNWLRSVRVAPFRHQIFRRDCRRLCPRSAVLPLHNYSCSSSGHSTRWPPPPTKQADPKLEHRPSIRFSLSNQSEATIRTEFHLKQHRVSATIPSAFKSHQNWILLSQVEDYLPTLKFSKPTTTSNKQAYQASSFKLLLKHKAILVIKQ